MIENMSSFGKGRGIGGSERGNKGRWKEVRGRARRLNGTCD